jgi:hypothetical protein
MIPVVATPQEVIGKVDSVELVQGNFGEQVKIVITPSNPEATNVRMFFFKPSDNQSSKWMKFVASFNKANGSAIKVVEEMVGVYVRIEEVKKSGKVQNEDREWTEPVVREVFASADAALSAWGLNRASANVNSEPVEVAPIAQIPDAVAGILKQKWVEVSGKNQGVPAEIVNEIFWNEVKGWGFDRQSVLAIKE